jgi:hypothetical protein
VAAIRKGLFLRFYGHEFDASTRGKILAAIERAASQSELRVRACNLHQVRRGRMLIKMEGRANGCIPQTRARMTALNCDTAIVLHQEIGGEAPREHVVRLRMQSEWLEGVSAGAFEAIHAGLEG